MTKQNRKTAIILLALGVLAVFSMSPTTGKPYTGNPGDCLLEGSGWTSTDGGCKDPQGVVWSTSQYNTTQSWVTQAQATNYCSALVEGGYSDWRLPTKDEMTDATDSGAGTHLNLIFDSASSQPYDTADRFVRWSSSMKAKKYFWIAYLGNGQGTWTVPSSTVDALCVRKP